MPQSLAIVPTFNTSPLKKLYSDSDRYFAGGDFNGYFNDGLARILESRSKDSETYDLGRREGSYREGESEILDDDFKQFEVKKRREREVRKCHA